MDASLKCHLVIHLDISRNEAIFLFYLSNDFEVRCTVEGIASLMEKLEKMVGNMSACDFESFEAGFDDIAAVDWDAVGDTITTIEKHGSIHTLSKE